jgi:hypothetical protein
MEKQVTRRTAVHVRVAGQLLSQNSEGLSSAGQLQQPDAGTVPQPEIGLDCGITTTIKRIFLAPSLPLLPRVRSVTRDVSPLRGSSSQSSSA